MNLFNRINIKKQFDLMQQYLDFYRPQKKMLYAIKDENFDSSKHELYEMHKMAEQICRYDLDKMDVTWLELYNQQREEAGKF